MYTGSLAVSPYNTQNRWTTPTNTYTAPTPKKNPVKIATQSKITGLIPTININNLSDTCRAKEEDFSTLDIYELLKLRECSIPCRNKAHDELIQRLNKGTNTFPHIGISRFVFEETSQGVAKEKPLLKQIIEFFGKEHCSKIHHLDLTYNKNDFNDLQYFTGLKSLNLTSTNFEEFWVLDLMPNLKELIPSREELEANTSTDGNYYG